MVCVLVWHIDFASILSVKVLTLVSIETVVATYEESEESLVSFSPKTDVMMEQARWHVNID